MWEGMEVCGREYHAIIKLQNESKTKAKETLERGVSSRYSLKVS